MKYNMWWNQEVDARKRKRLNQAVMQLLLRTSGVFCVILALRTAKLNLTIFVILPRLIFRIRFFLFGSELPLAQKGLEQIRKKCLAGQGLSQSLNRLQCKAA